MEYTQELRYAAWDLLGLVEYISGGGQITPEIKAAADKAVEDWYAAAEAIAETDPCGMANDGGPCNTCYYAA